ncbi:MAG: hypothetical protein SNJ69_14780 [Chloroflexaceae bacterium]
MMTERSRGFPMWIWGVLVALILIALSSRGNVGVTNETLRQRFAAQPTPAGIDLPFEAPQLEIGALPPQLQEAARELLWRLNRGEAGRPVEPAVESARLRIEVRELRRVADEVYVRGEVTNISRREVQVPISAFELRDSAGISYLANSGASSTLRPGQSTPLELSVPLPPGRGLLLTTSLPPDPPVEQRLIVADTTP